MQYTVESPGPARVLVLPRHYLSAFVSRTTPGRQTGAGVGPDWGQTPVRPPSDPGPDPRLPPLPDGYNQGSDMKLLFAYLRNYKGLVALALVLATINQVFSLLDPLIFRHVIDEYATRFQEYTTGEFFRGVSLLLGAAVGVAFVSRVAKNFQDYYINVITQRLGAQLYSDGIRHSLELPYSVFEDQRSGETLGQAAEGAHRRREADRDEHQRAVHVARRHRLRDGLRVQRALADRAGLLPDGADPRRAQLGAEPAHQADPEGHRRRNDGAGRIDDRVAAQHRAREEPRARAAGDRPPQRRRPARS